MSRDTQPPLGPPSSRDATLMDGGGTPIRERRAAPAIATENGSWRVELDARTGILTKKLHGRVSMDDILECSETTRQHPVFGTAELGLVDLDGAQVDFSPAELRALSAHLRRNLCGGRWAIVARGDLAYGLSRIVTALADGDRPLAVFRSHADAADWLTKD